MAERKIVKGWVVERRPDGTFVPVSPAGQDGQMPADPLFPYKAPKAATDLEGAKIDNAVKGATAADVINKAKADARKAEAEAKKAEEDLKRGGLTPDQIAERQAKVTQFNALAAQINRVQELYNEGVGKTKGPLGLLDYLPSDKNAAFDAAGAALSQQGLGAFRIPGTGTVSDRDAIMFDRANLPTAATRDAAIEEQLRGLRSRLEQEYASRGLPAPQWTPGNQSVRSAPQVSRTVAQGQTRNEFSAPLSLKVDALMNAGASKAEIDAMLAANKFPPLDGKTYNEARQWMSANPGKSYFGANINRSVDNTALERFSGSPLGSAVIGAANMGGFGGVQALAPEAYQASQDANPTAAMIGSIGGGLAGTSILGRIGAGTVGRLAPRLMQGGGKAQFGRNLAADATYGGIYGGVTEGDPLTGAGVAALGSAGGQALGSVAGRAVGGLTATPAADALRRQGISLTTGQALGGIAKSLEDKAMSIPGVGDMIRARRLEGLQDFNRVAMNQAGAPIGATTQDIGEQGLQNLFNATSNAYERATSGVTVPLDGQFTQGLNAARAQMQQLPPDLAARGEAAIRNRIDPIASGATGPVYSLPMPSKLNKPLPPTPEQVARLARVEEVPLSQARAGQSRMAWKDQNAGRFTEPLVDGYGDIPLVVRMENGEHIVYDGNHRAVRALNAGKATLNARVIDAKSIDPANAGRPPVASSINDEELLRELGVDITSIPRAPITAPSVPREFPAMTGDTYQQAVRGLKGYKAELTKPGFEADYRNALQSGIDVLTDQMKRGGGERVVQGLDNANAAYRNTKTLQKAVEAAKNGTGSGEIQVFTPAQLNTAAYAAANKYPGPRPFARLADAGQQVLPSQVPNSGTTDRLLSFALPTALGGTAVGADSLGFENAASGLGLLAAMSAGGTKAGQAAINKALLDRPQTAAFLGSLIRKHKGLLGSAFVPLALEANK